MSAWWTYRPSDFLMFAPDTYWRQFELHNDSLWPTPPLVALLALAWGVVLQAAPVRQRIVLLRAGLLTMAAATGFVAWAFLWQRYADILWAARAFAYGHALLATGLLALALWPRLGDSHHRWRWRVGLGLLLWAAVAHPLLPLLWSAPLAQSQWLGAAPDPTALAALGLLLCVRAGDTAGPWPARALQTGLIALCLTWCAISAATLWTMGSQQGWGLALPALLACAAVLRKP
ncbi:MAG: hypothetical protein MUF76_03340 [Hydrogenophaga sp.]|jgi:hypothetical protein|nr:hypothetical protein [Hydrogenophaga sp.]